MNQNLYSGLFDDKSFDSAKGGASQGDVFAAETMIFARIRTSTGADGRDQSGRFPVIGITTKLYGDDPGSYPADFAGMDPVSDGAIAGQWRVEKAGKFLYFDRELAASLGIYEVYVAFDDAHDTSAVPITPGTALQRTFGRFRVTAIAFEDPATLLAACDAAHPDAYLRVRFFISDNLQLHARPDLRVKISDVGQQLTIGAAQINVLATQLASIYQENAGILLGAPQSIAAAGGDARLQNKSTYYTSFFVGNPGAGVGGLSNPCNPAYYVDPPAGEYLQTTDKIRVQIFSGGVNAAGMGVMLYACPYSVFTGATAPITFDAGLAGFGILVDAANNYPGRILILDYNVTADVRVGMEMISGEYLVPSGWIVACAYAIAADLTIPIGAYVNLSRWMVGANQPFGGLA